MSNVTSLNPKKKKTQKEFLQSLEEYDPEIAVFICVQDGTPVIHANDAMVPDIYMLLDIVKQALLEHE